MLYVSKYTPGPCCALHYLVQVQKVEDRKFVSVTREGRLHGLALWFDVTFNPMVYDEDQAAKIQKVLQTNPTTLVITLIPISKVVLGTGPRDVPTHWKQTVLLLLGDGGQTLEEDEVCPTKSYVHQIVDCHFGFWPPLSQCDSTSYFTHLPPGGWLAVRYGAEFS